MTKKESLQLFHEQKIRTLWDDKEEKWYFSIVDAIASPYIIGCGKKEFI